MIGNNTRGLDFDKIGYNSLLGLHLFKDEIESSLIFHIPHSKTEIPEQFQSDFVSTKLMENEIKLLTDFATDEIFTIGSATKLVFPYSRIFCDVERLDDENEVMFERGRGFYYTKTDNGELLRENLNGSKKVIYDEYYLKHHQTLTNLVDQKLHDIKFCVIVDCHSFADVPFSSDIEQHGERPDFCIGTDEFHTPKWLSDMAYDYLIQQGYSVKINYPYVGTIVPMKHYKANEDVHSIMIEINRKLYMDGGIINHSKVSKLNHLMSNLFLVNN